MSGVKVDWRAALPGAGFVELPTYAFERRRFWLSGDGAAVDAAGLGLGASEHALLGAVVELPDSGGVVLTGRLSPATQGWLTDHAVDGVVVFPGAGFVELAIRAGDEVGCPVVDELTLQAPLLLPASGLGRGAGGRGRRPTNPASAACPYSPGSSADSAWTCHATGQLSSGPVEPGADLSVWPPEGATAVDVTDGYQRLAARGYQYGPAFQGLTALWRRGEEFFAEVTLPQAAGGVSGFGVHPVLLDAALHAAAVTHRRRRRGRNAAVLVAGRVAACGGGVVGAGADCAVGSVGGVGGTGRRAGVAGAVGDVDDRPPDFPAAVDGGGFRRWRGSAVRAGVVAHVGRVARRDAGVRGVRVRFGRPGIRSTASYERVHEASGGAAVLVGRTRFRRLGGVDPRRGGVAGGGRHRSGRCRGVGVGAFGADRASRPDRAGGFRCAAE